MRRFWHALLVGLVGAAFVHVVIALMLPQAVAEKKWKGLAAALPAGRIVTGPLPLFAPNPFMRLAACRFDLAGQPMRLHAAGPVSAWILTVYGRNGAALASLSDEAAPGGLLDVTVLTPAQRPANPAALPAPLPLEVDAAEVLAVVEVFVPDATWEPASARFLQSASCVPAR